MQFKVVSKPVENTEIVGQQNVDTYAPQAIYQ
jgi:hypothetical protein